jgi:hypothetical protein
MKSSSTCLITASLCEGPFFYFYVDSPLKGHVPSFQFLGVWLQHKEINLVLSIAGILQVLHKTDGEEKWERGLL